MIQQFWILLSLFLILIIFLRMPQETVGLSSFANKSDILGSPTSTQRTLNIITGLAVIVYVLLAFKLNLRV
uniref:Preprotein translocase SecG subunit n=1 Tax=Licmophora sp. TaxID=2115823 RepID=A0A2U9NNI9_9STRA|nr:preprotein translocase SecG subunit [Licmophora sp.]